MIKRAVIIDDSMTVRKIVEISLRRAGITTWCYADGNEALRALAHPQHPTPDLFILDINLPTINGYGVARALKHTPQFKDTAIIMLSSRKGRIDRFKSHLSGANCHMTKPFQTQELLSVIAQYGDLPG